MSSKSIYTSPLCSCIECRKQYSQKSIHTHFIYSHTSNKKENTGKGTQKFIIKCSCLLCKQELTIQSLDRHIKKHINDIKPKPQKICPSCGVTHAKEGKFCSRSCANKRTHSHETKDKIKYSLTKTPTFTKINNRVCINCGKIEFSKFRFQSEFCKFCNVSLTYRNACKFTFDLRKFPDEFNLSLLETHGMFNPKTNPTGVSRDHLLSVDYGKHNKIDPKIISHPANCQIILQSDNSRKNNKNSISLDQLLEKIKDWDLKYSKINNNL